MELKWKDVAWPQASAKFAELPSHTTFLESSCHNDVFDKGALYVPAQTKDAVVILRLDLSADTPSSVQVYTSFRHQAPGLYPDPSDTDVFDQDLSPDSQPFGSDLSDDGVMYMCIFNKNLLVMFDLRAKRVLHKVKVPAPNDVCRGGPGVAYVACGVWVDETSAGNAISGHLSMHWAMNRTKDWKAVTPTEGSVYKVSINGDKTSTEVVAKGTKALAGIEVSQEQLWLSMLVNVNAVPLKALGPTLRPDTDENRKWIGYAADLAYLADNVSTYDDSRLIVPCYRALSRRIAVLAVENKCTSTLGSIAARICSCCIKFYHEPNAHVAQDFALSFTDASVDPGFVNKDTFPHIHFVILNTKSGKYENFRIKLPDSMVSQGSTAEFDGHVTHMDHVGNKLVFTNFLKQRLLIIPDSIVAGSLPNSQ